MAIVPSPPLGIAVVVYLGVRQPQPGSTSRITSGSLSLFLNLKVAVTGLCQRVVPVLIVVWSKDIFCAVADSEIRNSRVVIVFFIITNFQFQVRRMPCEHERVVQLLHLRAVLYGATYELDMSQGN